MTGKTPFSAEAWKNVDWLRQATDCFDLTIRSVNVNDRQCLLVFVGGVTGTTSIEPIVESLVFDKGNLAFFPATVTQAGSLEDALDKILQGQTLVILEGSASVAARLQEMNELLEPMHIHLENFGQNSLICRPAGRASRRLRRVFAAPATASSSISCWIWGWCGGGSVIPSW